MFTTSQYLSSSSLDIRLKRMLIRAKNATSIRDIDMNWFRHFDIITVDNKVKVLIDCIENIIKYNSLLFTLQEYVDESGLRVDDFKNDIIDVSVYRSVGELLVEEYSMPTNRQIYEMMKNKNSNVEEIMNLIEDSRQMLVDIINDKKRLNYGYIRVDGLNNITRGVRSNYSWDLLLGRLEILKLRSEFDDVVITI